MESKDDPNQRRRDLQSVRSLHLPGPSKCDQINVFLTDKGCHHRTVQKKTGRQLIAGIRYPFIRYPFSLREHELRYLESEWERIECENEIRDRTTAAELRGTRLRDLLEKSTGNRDLAIQQQTKYVSKRMSAKLPIDEDLDLM